ncbi:MAG: methylated-DNA--[protein]-cysteine S-methyltransferase, partial [Nitrospirota bacterium]
MVEQVNGYFNGTLREFNIRTRFLDGTVFEREVWEALKGVKYGETRSYKWLAEKIGRPKAARAVGRALMKNPIPIVYPCHRIIEADNNIGGYNVAGAEIKRRLLEMEYYFGIND